MSSCSARCCYCCFCSAVGHHNAVVSVLAAVKICCWTRGTGLDSVNCLIKGCSLSLGCSFSVIGVAHVPGGVCGEGNTHIKSTQCQNEVDLC
jgi:hypothetical protein